MKTKFNCQPTQQNPILIDHSCCNTYEQYLNPVAKATNQTKQTKANEHTLHADKYLYLYSYFWFIVFLPNSFSPRQLFSQKLDMVLFHQSFMSFEHLLQPRNVCFTYRLTLSTDDDVHEIIMNIIVLSMHIFHDYGRAHIFLPTYFVWGSLVPFRQIIYSIYSSTHGVPFITGSRTHLG